MMQNDGDVLILGGGVIGLMQALSLAREGLSVTVAERGRLGGESSWAGGGIVSPLYPWRYAAPVTALAHWAQDFYPAFCADLLETTGIDPEFELSGMLMLDAEDEAQALAWAAAQGRVAERLDAAQAHALQPGLGGEIHSALWMPQIGQVRPPRLVVALRAALEAMPGVRILEGCEVLSLSLAGGRIRELETRRGRLRAEAYVFCTGAWSALLAEQLGLRLAIRPMRGQMLLFGASPAELKRMVMREGRYLIPRRDGRLLVGSTLEDVGFQRLPTEAAYCSLKASALALVPALEGYTVEAQWTGLRPASPNGIPYIGRMPEAENAWINAGHFRNGVVLAPAATRLLADCLLARRAIVEPGAYGWDAERACSQPV